MLPRITVQDTSSIDYERLNGLLESRGAKTCYGICYNLSISLYKVLHGVPAWAYGAAHASYWWEGGLVWDDSPTGRWAFLQWLAQAEVGDEVPVGFVAVWDAAWKAYRKAFY